MPLRGEIGKRQRQSLMRQAQRRGNQAAAPQASARATHLAPIILKLRAAGATTLQAIADGLNAHQIPAARGGTWSRMQVARVLLRLGYPKQSTLAVGRAALAERAFARATHLAPIIFEIQATGATTLQAIADGLNARQTPAARGAMWSRSQVARVIARALRRPVVRTDPFPMKRRRVRAAARETSEPASR